MYYIPDGMSFHHALFHGTQLRERKGPGGSQIIIGE